MRVAILLLALICSHALHGGVREWDHCLYDIIGETFKGVRGSQLDARFSAKESDLVPGRRLWVHPAILADFRNLQRYLGSPQPVEIVARSRRAPGGGFRGAGDLVRFRHVEGEFTVPTAEFLEHGFTQAPVYGPDDFVPGDIVLLHASAGGNFQAATFDPEVRVVTVSGPLQPLVGFFLEPFSDNYLVDVPFLERLISRGASRLIVNPDDVMITPAGSAWRVRERLAPLRRASIEFERGDEIRFRDADGKMRLGTYKTRSGERATVVDKNGTFHVVSPARIFRVAGPYEPFTADFAMPWFDRVNDFPGPLYREVLDAGAWLTSHPDFLAAPVGGKLEYVMEFVSSFVYTFTQTETLSGFGLRSMDAILMVGGGDCKYKAELMAAVLNEAGYYSMLVEAVRNDPRNRRQRIGHMWVETNLGADGQGQPYRVVSDPGMLRIVSAWAVPAYARRDRFSPEAVWYNYRGRRYHAPLYGRQNARPRVRRAAEVESELSYVPLPRASEGDENAGDFTESPEN